MRTQRHVRTRLSKNKHEKRAPELTIVSNSIKTTLFIHVNSWSQLLLVVFVHFGIRTMKSSIDWNKWTKCLKGCSRLLNAVNHNAKIQLEIFNRSFICCSSLNNLFIVFDLDSGFWFIFDFGYFWCAHINISISPIAIKQNIP